MTKIIHIENTSVCNASCPMCARNILGSGTVMPIGSLSFDKFKSSINQVLPTLEKVFFCGNLGDPCADPNLLEKIKWLKQVKTDCIIGINTNGSIKNAKWWNNCAKLLNGNLDYVVFSIDGLEDTNHIYRVNVIWNKIMTNADAYIQAGGIAHWDMLVFDHNKHQVEECNKLAEQMGFFWFRSKETDRWDQFKFDDLKPVEEYKPFDYDKIQNISCERNIENSTFVDYTGKEFPCCHIAEMYYSKTQREKHRDILSHSPQELMFEYQIQTPHVFLCSKIHSI